jgi:hypothetical protein
MPYALDIGTVIVGAFLGLGLGTAIVVFLVYAALRAVCPDGDSNTDARLINGGPPLTRHDTHYAYFEAARRDLDVIDW